MNDNKSSIINSSEGEEMTIEFEIPVISVIT